MDPVISQNIQIIFPLACLIPIPENVQDKMSLINVFSFFLSLAFQTMYIIKGWKYISDASCTLLTKWHCLPNLQSLMAAEILHSQKWLNFI